MDELARFEDEQPAELLPDRHDSLTYAQVRHAEGCFYWVIAKRGYSQEQPRLHFHERHRKALLDGVTARWME